MIEITNVSISYGKEKKIFDNLSFSIEDDETVGLIGANGAGKTTLMKTILGLLPYEGSIVVNGKDVCQKNIMDIRKEVGFVLQNSDNQMFMPTVKEDIIFGPMNYGLNYHEAEKVADEVLEQLNISEIKYSYNHKLSGGEKRMAAIAAVLAMNPHIIMMDEPTSALDPYNRRVIINSINDLKTSKIIASHDLDMIYDTCDRVLLLNHGKIIADGKKEEVLTDKELLEKNRMELPMRLQSM